MRCNSLDGVGSPQFRPEQGNTMHTHTDNSGEFWFVRDVGMRARRQTGSGWSHTQDQQSTVGHRYVNTRSWLRTHCHTRTSTITDCYCIIIPNLLRTCAPVLFSRAHLIQSRIRAWMSECLSVRMDASRMPSGTFQCDDKNRNRIIKSLIQKGETC